MSYELTSRVEDDVLIATVTGSRSPRSIITAAQETKDLCEKHGVDKTLIDVREFEGPLGTVDAFVLVTKHFALLRDFRVSICRRGGPLSIHSVNSVNSVKASATIE